MTITTNEDRVAYNLELMKKGDDAFNSRDEAGMTAIHHPDMVAHVTGSPEAIIGSQAHSAMIEQMISIFPDVHVDNDPYPLQFGSGDWTTVITRARGTFTGKIPLPDGNAIEPTGKAFDLDFTTTARWEGDVMVEEYVFWDSALQAQQIGLAG
jgi:hypothetical protein